MGTLTYCLGIKAFGLCTYDPLKPGVVYFTIGEAIGSIALLLAFTQLVTPTLKFRLRVRRNVAIISAALFALAFISVVIAAVIPSVLGYVIPILGFPIFWEVVAAGFIVGGVACLGFIYLRPTKFIERNYKSYFDACMRAVSGGDERELGLLSEEVGHAARQIVQAAKRFDVESARRARLAGEQRVATDMPDYAVGLLDLFSDARFARATVDGSPGTAVAFIRALGHISPGVKVGHSLVQQLVKQALLSDSSMLHREEEYDGLGHFKWFTRAVFGDYAIVSGPYRPLQALFYTSGKNVTSDVTQKYGRALKMALDAYFVSRDFHGRPDALLAAIDEFGKSPRGKVLELRRLPSSDVFASQAYGVLADIDWALSQLITLVVDHEGELPNYPFDANNYDRFADYSIYGVLAHGVYVYLESLSMALSHDDTIRDAATVVWQELAFPTRGRGTAILEIQKRLLVHLTRKMTGNLEKGHYPMVTRLLISLVGLWDTSNSDPASLDFATLKVHELVRDKFAKAFAADNEKARDMLPENVSFDENTNELVEVLRSWKSERRFKVKPAR